MSEFNTPGWTLTLKNTVRKATIEQALYAFLEFSLTRIGGQASINTRLGGYPHCVLAHLSGIKP